MEENKFKIEYALLKNSINNLSVDSEMLESKIVEYPNNFMSNDEIIETTINLDYNANVGFSKHLVFNGIRIEFRDLNLTTPVQAEVSLNFPYFKMQFSLDGYYSYKTSNSKSLDVEVNKGCHQLFYFPEVKKSLISFGSNNKHNKTLEISLSLDFLYRVFRHSWEVLDLLGKAIKNDTPLVYGSECKKISPEIYNVIQQIQNCSVRKELRRAYLEAKVIELLILQIDDLEPDEDGCNNIPEIKHYNKIKAAKAFIEANIDSNLTIPFIAKNVGLNINCLKSEFKELYGETIFQYLTSLRMQHANDLVKYTDSPITEIANKVGYKHAQHFTKTFKKHFHQTPTELRKC